MYSEGMNYLWFFPDNDKYAPIPPLANWQPYNVPLPEKTERNKCYDENCPLKDNPFKICDGFHMRFDWGE
jgi:hypothetical protein